MISSSPSRILMCGIVSLLSLASSEVLAVDRQWNVPSSGTGDFTLGSNWNPSFAVAWGTADRPIISNGGTSILSTGAVAITEMWVGQNGMGIANGNMQQTGGSLTASDGLVVGRQGSAVGTYTMTGGSLSLVNFRLGGGTATASGMMTVSGAETTVSTAGTGHTSIGSPGIGSLTITDSAVWTHGGTNPFLVGSDNNTVGANGGTGTLVVQNNAILQLVGTSNFTIGRNNLGNGTVTVDGGTIALSGPAAAINLGALNGGTTGGTGSLTIDSGSVSGSIVKVLEGTGTINLNGGTLTTGSITEGTGSGTIHFNGGTIRAAKDSFDFFSGFEMADLDAQSGGLIFDTNDHSVTFLQGISGTGGVTKTGTGTLTMTVSNDYSGATMVAQGTLAVTGSAFASEVSVEGGGTLSGSGAVGPTHVKANGVIAPGNGIGPLFVDSAVFDGLSKLQLDISDIFGDVLDAFGAVSLDGSVDLDIAMDLQPVFGTVYTIVNSGTGILGYGEGGRLSYQGNDLDEGERFLVVSGEFSQEFAISYGADGGLDITIEAIPEPTALSAVLGGTGLLLGLARRRRR